jgi:hypothetical protein
VHGCERVRTLRRVDKLGSLTATRVAHLPPISVLFASFLGYNPATELLGPHVLSGLTASNAAAVGGRSFFPGLLSSPFHSGLKEAFSFSVAACLVAAAASWWDGAKPVVVSRREPALRESGGEFAGLRPTTVAPEATSE